MVVGACILSILCSTFVTVTSMLANFRYQSLHISHTVQSRRLQRTPLLREKSIPMTRRGSAVPMGSRLRSQGQSRYYLYSGQPSSRCAVEYRRTAWQCSPCMHAPTNIHRTGRPRFQSSAMIFRNRPLRPPTFTSLFSRGQN